MEKYCRLVKLSSGFSKVVGQAASSELRDWSFHNTSGWWSGQKREDFWGWGGVSRANLSLWELKQKSSSLGQSAASGSLKIRQINALSAEMPSEFPGG